MNRRRAARTVSLGLLAVAGLLWPDGARGEAQDLRGAILAPGPDAPSVVIEIDWPFRYETHTPPTRGKLLEIRLRPITAAALAGAPVTSTLPWREREQIPLVEIELERGSDALPRLRLRFDREVEFDVSQGRDLHAIRVEVRTRPRAAPRAGEPHLEHRSAPAPTPGGTGEARVDEIIAEGRDAMISGDLKRAVLLFTRALEEPEHPRRAEAKELLGLAYQRRGKWSHARAEYEEYLRDHPDSPGAPRVRQRLESLLTAAESNRRSRTPAPAKPAGLRHAYHGGVSQFYRWNRVDLDSAGSSIANRSLDTDVYLVSRHDDGRISYRTNLSGSYYYDLNAETRDPATTRISSAFVDVRALDERHSARLGRQSATGGGVLGRYDGVKLGYQLDELWRLEGSSGFLVDFTDSNKLDTRRPFAGISAEVGPLFGHWDAEFFAIHQRDDGMEDRSAVGAQLRFASQAGFALALLDYEISYGALNNFMLISNWRINKRTSVNAFVDVRKTPALTTHNALQGQLVERIDDLRDTVSDDDIRELAEDRTATSRMATVGASHQIDSTWQVSGDLTISNISGTSASPGIAATEGTGNEYFLALRAGAVNLLLEGSYTSLALRLSHVTSGRRYMASTGGRYPVVEGLRMGPQLIVEYRDNDTGPDVWTSRPTLRFDYRWRGWQLELEGGFELEKGTANDASADETEYFWYAGYRYDF